MKKKYSCASDSLRSGQLDSLISRIKDFNPTAKPTIIELSHWKKGMKIKCPECNKTMTDSYVCCGIQFKPVVNMKF